MSQIFQIRPQQFALPIPAPVADFDGVPVSGDIPLNVNFTFTGSGTITEYRWDFESVGSAQSTVKNPSFVFTTAGTFDVTLFVSGPGGNDTITKPAYINAVQITDWDLWQGGSAVSVTLSNTSGASTTVSAIFSSTEPLHDADYSTIEDYALTYGDAVSAQVLTIFSANEFWFDKAFDTIEDYSLTYGTTVSAQVSADVVP